MLLVSYTYNSTIYPRSINVPLNRNIRTIVTFARLRSSPTLTRAVNYRVNSRGLSRLTFFVVADAEDRQILAEFQGYKLSRSHRVCRYFAPELSSLPSGYSRWRLLHAATRTEFHNDPSSIEVAFRSSPVFRACFQSGYCATMGKGTGVMEDVKVSTGVGRRVVQRCNERLSAIKG